MEMLAFIIGYAAFFVLAGLWVGIYPRLIAGYHTMSDAERKNVDIKGLKVFLCCGLCGIGIAVLFVYLAIWRVVDEVSALALSSVVVPIVGVVFLLAGAQRYDHNGRKRR